ncbi:tyrosine-type recombinase/integrase [Oceanidesulfovibrio marinus]|uniref:Integrase n=1 Tax=Oceanidesulfovibrio marinus TaxID=370038 RepID=A0A6P1ZAF8_9BACT|nr:integrase arm-type DNA-binding domain-containing protein [Oceanidesulfovibrio marinus]TVM30532.1 integrase [Oceanidesulfovibrio marinus]
MPLTDAEAKNAKPREKAYRLYDSEGLYLEVAPTGSKLWRLKYRFDGKEKRLALGKYPTTSLKKARDKRHEAKGLLDDGVDPSAARKKKRQDQTREETRLRNTYEAVAREWFGKFLADKAPGHRDTVISRQEKNIFPHLGSRPIDEIEPPELLAAIKRIEARGALEVAHRTLQVCGQIFRYGVASGYCPRDSAADLRGALPPSKTKHHASITEPKEVASLLRAIDGYSGHFVTRCALRLAPLLFVRPGELRHAEWKEINFDSAEWRIPAEKMKMRRGHIVPLSRQALEILRELHFLTGEGKYLFPSMRTASRPFSENTVNASLRRMGYSKDEMTGHGFRSMASTLLNEHGWNRDAIERQLAHVEGNSVRAAYNYAELLPERRKMMQWWADYLESLRG